MPTRLISDTFFTSPSIRKCSPAAQDAFPRFLLLADDFGCFEAAARVLVGRGWPYREEVTDVHVHSWLVEYASAGMVHVWDEEARWWGHFVGWFKFQRRRDEYSARNPKGSKRKTPVPPAKQGDVVAFAAGDLPGGKSEPSPGFPGGKSEASSGEHFPGGKRTEASSEIPGGKQMGATASESTGFTETGPTDTPFPGGNTTFPGNFPRTQSQFAVRSTVVPQAQREPPSIARTNRGIGLIGDFWERERATPFGGAVRTLAEVLLDEGYESEHLMGSLAEAMRADLAGECRSLAWAFEAVARKSPRGGPYTWRAETKRPEKPPPSSRTKPFVPTAPPEDPT